MEFRQFSGEIDGLAGAGVGGLCERFDGWAGFAELDMGWLLGLRDELDLRAVSGGWWLRRDGLRLRLESVGWSWGYANWAGTRSGLRV